MPVLKGWSWIGVLLGGGTCERCLLLGCHWKLMSLDRGWLCYWAWAGMRLRLLLLELWENKPDSVPSLLCVLFYSWHWNTDCCVALTSCPLDGTTQSCLCDLHNWELIKSLLWGNQVLMATTKQINVLNNSHATCKLSAFNRLYLFKKIRTK